MFYALLLIQLLSPFIGGGRGGGGGTCTCHIIYQKLSIPQKRTSCPGPLCTSGFPLWDRPDFDTAEDGDEERRDGISVSGLPGPSCGWGGREGTER